MHPTLNIAVRAARKAGEIIMQSLGRLESIEITSKGRNDYVTEVDKQAERAIKFILAKSFPEHSFLAEESGHSGNSDPTWIIDPLDGTANFIHGLGHFSVSIALRIEGQIAHGVIYDPIRQELFTASRGQGAQVNDKKMRVSKRHNLKGALLGCGFPFREQYNIEEYMALVQDFYPIVSGFRRAGSAALDLAYVAAGRLDGFWEVGLKSWDIAAGSLLVREAGGLVTDTNGEEDYLNSGNVVAANPKILADMINILRRHNPS